MTRLTWLAGVVGSVSALVSLPVSRNGQHPLSLTPSAGKSHFKCDLPPALDPKEDGLPSALDLFSSEAALHEQIKRHQAIVRVPSICYDDLGDFDKDDRWKPFYKLHDVLAETYPTV